MSSQQSSSNNNNPNQSLNPPSQFDHYSEQDDEYTNEDLPHEIVAELDANHRAQNNRQNFQPVDDAVFSDDVQNAFKKYQNEQEELYAQMEECWNYMAQESHPPKPSLDESQASSLLNPDATEFKPSWLPPSNDQVKDSQPKY